MTRMWYTDPFKAAYMAREFGVRLFSRDSELYEDKGRLKDSDGCWWYGRSEVRHSLPVFEPQEGDVVRVDRWFWRRQRDERFDSAPYSPMPATVIDHKEWLSFSTPGVEYDNNMNGSWAIPFHIIQREGKAFFWPEKEGE